MSGPQSNRFLSNRGLLKDPVIILSENNNTISDQTPVSNILNNFYVNVAKDIGTDLTSDGVTSHPSCQLITSIIQTPIHFDFKPVTQENIQALISKCSSKKATGIDGIPANFFKSCCRTISKPLSKLINYLLCYLVKLISRTITSTE